MGNNNELSIFVALIVGALFGSWMSYYSQKTAQINRAIELKKCEYNESADRHIWKDNDTKYIITGNKLDDIEKALNRPYITFSNVEKEKDK